MSSARHTTRPRASRSNECREIFERCAAPGTCRATGPTRSRTIWWSWRRDFGSRIGSCARRCAKTCQECCARCVPVLKPHRKRHLVASRPARALALAWLSLFASSACEREPEAPPMRVKRVFHLNPYEKDFGYSQAVLIDKTLYISGSVAADEHGRLVSPGDMAGQMRAAYSNIRRTLAAHGADFEEVVKETIYTTDMDALLKASDLRFEYYDKERLPTTPLGQMQRFGGPGFLL